MEVLADKGWRDTIRARSAESVASVVSTAFRESCKARQEAVGIEYRVRESGSQCEETYEACCPQDARVRTLPCRT